MNAWISYHGYLYTITAGPLAAKLGGSALTEASKQVGNKEVAGMAKDQALVCDSV